MKIQGLKLKTKKSIKILSFALWFYLLPFTFSFYLLCSAQEVQQNSPAQEEKQKPVPQAEAKKEEQGEITQQPATKEEGNTASVPQAEAKIEEGNTEAVPQTEANKEEQTVVVESLAKTQNVTLDFKEADIRNVLKIIAIKTGVNIIATPEVMGNVSIRLVNVPWDKALDAILKTYGFGYDRQESIIIVAPIEKLTAQKKQEVELAQVQPTVTEVFNMKYIDAMDAKKALETQLSARGKITVLETTGQAGWEFGATGELGKRKRAAEGRISRSKTFIISDIPPVLDKIKEIIQKIDVQPQQILIQAKLVEVNHNKLQDLGFDWGLGTGGPTSLSTYRQQVTTYYWTLDSAGMPTKGTYNDLITLPELPLNSKGTKRFGAQSLPALNVGEFLFRKLTGTDFEAVIKALEQKSDANTLSAPHIITLNNQEATILIGNKFPLLKSTVSAETGSITGQSLDRYQDIGIQLNVVPQISGKDYINLIVHPAVSSYTQTVKAVTSTGQTMAEYPIIITREAETSVLMKDGETIVIGGLITDAKSKTSNGIPILKDIPILGLLFQKNSSNTQKVDLLIFISAHIVKESEFSTEEITKLEKRLDRGPAKVKAIKPKQKQ